MVKTKLNQENASPQPGAQSAGLTTEELAEAINYHEESVRRAIRQGRIRALSFGRNYRIPPDEVARILTHGLPYVRGVA